VKAVIRLVATPRAEYDEGFEHLEAVVICQGIP
jgi:hypothetical protein